MGMNFQDVLRDVHDPSQHALKTTAEFSGDVSTGMTTIFPGPNSIGLVTLNPSSAHIGSVSIFGSITANTGMTTLFPGPNYIGLTTAVIGNNPVLGAGLNGVGFATVAVSTPTLFAVVNTGAAGVTDVTSDSGVTVYQGGTWTVTQASFARTITGNITLDPGSRTGILGNVTLSDAKTYIGLTTATIGNNPILGAGVNNIGFASVTPVQAWPDPKGYIGLVTITGSLAAASGNITLDPGSRTGILGNLTLSDSKNYIGLVTATIGNNPVLGAGLNNVGFATVAVSTPTLFAVVNTGAPGDPGTYIGLTTTTLGVGDRFVGLVTVVQSSAARTITSGTLTAVTDITNPIALKGNVTLSDAKTYVGLTTATLGVGTQFIGLVTANSRNAGTTKTLIPLPIALSVTSVVTIFVPSNTFKVTHLLLNSNATTRVSIKSGATYLTGNASIGVDLNPGGGWVENGSPDSPIYIGLAGAASFVVEKNDITSSVGGKVIYFDE